MVGGAFFNGVLWGGGISGETGAGGKRLTVVESDEAFWFWFMRKSAEMCLEVGEPARVDQAVCECVGVLMPEDHGC
jgi:hypothetical protein